MIEGEDANTDTKNGKQYRYGDADRASNQGKYKENHLYSDKNKDTCTENDKYNNNRR